MSSGSQRTTIQGSGDAHFNAREYGVEQNSFDQLTGMYVEDQEL
jgi:hypothetical protein